VHEATLDPFIAPRPVVRFIFLLIGATGTQRSTAPGVAWGRVF
jgi:hypothetical protein